MTIEKGRFAESLPRSSSDGRKRKIRVRVYQDRQSDGRKRKIRVRVYQDRQVTKKGRSGSSRSRELSTEVLENWNKGRVGKYIGSAD